MSVVQGGGSEQTLGALRIAAAQGEPVLHGQVQVGPRDLPEAIELMQRNDLPSAPRSQVSAAFPADSLVSTPLLERARLITAVEQRLEESLQLIDGVHHVELEPLVVVLVDVAAVIGSKGRSGGCSQQTGSDQSLGKFGHFIGLLCVS